MSISLAFEILVSLLLVITITYCFILDRRLKALRSGQDGVRQSISDLVQATLQAEQSIHKLTVTAEKVGGELESHIVEAKTLNRSFSKPKRTATTEPHRNRIPVRPTEPSPEAAHTAGLMARLKRAG